MKATLVVSAAVSGIIGSMCLLPTRSGHRACEPGSQLELPARQATL